MHVNPVYSVPWRWLCTYSNLIFMKSTSAECDLKVRCHFIPLLDWTTFWSLLLQCILSTAAPPPLPLYIVNLSPSQKSLDPSRIPDLVTNRLVELNCMQFCSLYNCQFVDMDQFQFSNRFRFKVLNLQNVTPSVTNETTYIIPYSNDINQFYIRMYHSLV